MIEKKTVLVLGAGASKPYGFPTGQELRDSVISQKKEIWFIKQAILGFSTDSYKRFSLELSRSGFGSVDAFLEETDEWLDIGKKAIAYNLLSTEVSCKDKLFPPNQPKDHWYETLWSILKAPSWNSFKRNPLSVVTFNYDQSLEHYLATVASRNYDIKYTTALRGIYSLPFVHVHGNLGKFVLDDGTEEYGKDISNRRFQQAKNGIRIVHEDKGQTREFELAKSLLNEADRILFIGFGYNQKNMSKLGLKELGQIDALGESRVLGTHKGLKSRAWGRICHRYGFSLVARGEGAGTISDLINEWLE